MTPAFVFYVLSFTFSGRLHCSKKKKDSLMFRPRLKFSILSAHNRLAIVGAKQKEGRPDVGH
jgi:hypothetical protein